MFDRAFAGVTLDLTLPELVLPGAGDEPAIAQPEYRNPASYFDEGNLAVLARLGREQRQLWTSTLAAIESDYGVPGEVILAIWGRETAFGRVEIPFNAIEALATGAFLGRRQERFRTELIAALQVLEAGHVAPEAMRSSWAGALGLPQFVPTSFLAYAVDFDGDARRDIWNSVPDTLASIANYLTQHGWDRNSRWGEEVSLPADVTCTLEGPDHGRPLAEWHSLGFVTESGALQQYRYLVLPAGRLGPSFLVSDNFYVIRQYNRSDAYALFVGHLADRIVGRTEGLSGHWGAIDDLTYGETRELQLRLLDAGYDVATGGLIGFRTRVAIGATQAALGLPETCVPDRTLLEALR